MSEPLDPKKLDLIGVLSGRDYPELEVPVYFNEKLGFSIQQMREMLKSLEMLGKDDEYRRVHEELEGLVKRTEDEKFVVTLRGIPEKVYRSIVDLVNEEHPDERDFLGQPKPNPKGDALFTRKLCEAYLLKVVGPSGSETLVGQEEVQAIIDHAPAPAQEAITKGISELRTGSKAGFEYAVKELDFLSSASPEG